MNTLPSELLQNIANRLSRRNLCVLLCVCRSWNLILKPQLYMSLDDITQQQFKELVKTLTDTAAHRPLGHLVRKLLIPITLDREDLSFLPQLFPSVTEISVKVRGRLDPSPILQQWKYLAKISLDNTMGTPHTFPKPSLQGCLTHVSVSTEGITGWVDVISEHASIQELTLTLFNIVGNNADNIISFSELEKLHHKLPRLRSLKIHNLKVHGDLPTHIASCNNLRELSLMSDSIHPWGHYFARKYTSLEALNLYVDWENDIEVKRGMAPLAYACRKLKKLNIPCMEVYNTFLDILSAIRAPMTHVTYDTWDKPWFSKTIHSFSNTLSCVKIHGQDDVVIKDVLERLIICPSLVDLELIFLFQDLGLDYILDELKGLQRLYLKGNRIVLERNRTSSIRHGLKDLALCGNDVEDAVHGYISQYCPLLQSLSCTYLRFHTRSITICYPHPGLQFLGIHSYRNAIIQVVSMDTSEMIREREKYGRLDDQMASLGQHRKLNKDDPSIDEFRSFLYDKQQGSVQFNENRFDRKDQPGAERHLVLVRCPYVNEILLSRGLAPPIRFYM
ncbi:hypothetical protein EC973_000494 [Apophysomyces ossiformis]|uniref:F-box domain-containing protein n=1 Tax=Apophysomyces ossiformis TaxID=679940 RepID=A0A8H7EP63_9FUNG|nr:hypothetical protein EC973_000494 [Apophysomyces ossiformis]